MSISNKLLVSENPIVVVPTLVKLFGFERAVVLQQLHFILNSAKSGRVLEDGHKYVWNTYEDWMAIYSNLWKPSSLKRHFLLLEEQGVVVTKQPFAAKWDKTKYYRIDYNVLDTLIEKLAEQDINMLDHRTDNMLDHRTDNMLDHRTDNMLDHRTDNMLDHRTDNMLDHLCTEISSETSTNTSSESAALAALVNVEKSLVLNLQVPQRIIYLEELSRSAETYIPQVYKLDCGVNNGKQKTRRIPNSFKQRMLLLSSYLSNIPITESTAGAEVKAAKELENLTLIGTYNEDRIYSSVIWGWINNEFEGGKYKHGKNLRGVIKLLPKVPQNIKNHMYKNTEKNLEYNKEDIINNAANASKEFFQRHGINARPKL